MNQHFIKLASTVAIAIALATTHAMAQNGSNSPYSRYGFGTLNDRAQGFNKAMAGTALGFHDPAEINFQNPASYSAIDSLAMIFDIGVTFQNANFKQGDLKKNAHNTTVDYINMAFRACRNLGMSIGLVPYSSVGYSFTNQQTMPDIDGSGEKISATTYNGDGGLHEVYVGLGWKFAKNFSIGANAGYLWGDYNHSVKASFSDTNIRQYARVYSADISTYKIDFGAQFDQLLSKYDLLTIGATYSLGHNVNSSAQFINEMLNSSGAVTGGDTVKLNNAFELPHTFGIGLAWNHKDRWKVGFDYSYELWKNVKFPMLVSENGTDVYKSTTGAFDNRQRFSLGAEFLPNNLGIRYSDHIRYRLGVSYGTSYTRVNENSGAKDIIVSAGVGLPIANIINNRSILNISAQWEHIRPNKSHLLTENYLRICIGLTFNERWFQKWKVE